MNRFVLLLLPALAAEGPTSALGGVTCTLGPTRVVATASEPDGPFSVRIGLGPRSGLVVWQPERAEDTFSLPVGPHGEPPARTPVGGGRSLGFDISHLEALQPVGDGFLLVGWGFSDLCATAGSQFDACVVALSLDTRGAPVGAPAVLSFDRLDVIAAPQVAVVDGVDLLIEADGLQLVRTRAGANGATLTTIPLGVEGLPMNAQMLGVGDARLVVLEDKALGGQVEGHRALWVRDGRTTAGPALAGRKTLWLLAELDGGAWAVFDGPGGAERRLIATDGSFGPAVPVAPTELSVTRGRVDVGSAYDAANQRIAGLLFHRYEVLRRTTPASVLLAPEEGRVARDVVALSDRWVAAWVGMAEGGWQVATREVWCPG